MAFNPDSDEHGDQWWGMLFFGVVMVGAAVGVYFYITHMETTGATGRINWIIALAYTLAGKWGAVLLLAIPGALMLIASVFKFIQWIRGFGSEQKVS